MADDKKLHTRAFGSEAVKQSGIDEAMIERLVHAFYARVRSDEILGPIFAARVTDWTPHLEQMCAFWSSVMLKSGRYHGQPMAKHVLLPVEGTHFGRWLMLFEQTAQELLPPPAAGHFLQRAQQIAGSLELGLAAARGEIRMPGAPAPRPSAVPKP